MGKKLIIFLLFHIFSFLLLIIGFIFILIQNIKNIIFYLERRKNIIAEKFIYEQFSHEIYSNINNKIFYEIEKKLINDSCENEYLIKFPIRIEYFYDCEGVYNDKIDKNECQNKITSSLLCCEQKCCRDQVISKERYHFCSENVNIPLHDSRSDLCSNISIYNGKFYYINNYKYCAKRYSKTYEELLFDNKHSKICKKNIPFDSVGHHFCLSDYNIPSSNPVIVQNIFSMVPPSYINIENSYRVSSLLNKKNYDESKISDEYKKLNEISNKNIEDAFKKSDEFIPNYYEKYESFNLKDLIAGKEVIFERFKNNNFFKSGNISWYTRNYIGFQNIDELKKFKNYFDENDHKNNSLYKISTSSLIFCISIVSVIIICFLFVLAIVIIICLFNKRETDTMINIYDKLSIYLLVISSSAFVIYLIIYLSCFIYKFDKIEINMETFFKKVLEKYMERRNQLYLLDGFIIFCINIFLYLLILIISKIAFKSKKVVNIRPINILLIKFRLKEGICEHIIKVDNNKTLNDYIKSFEKILEKCRNCKDNFIDVENILLGDRILNKDEEIKYLNLQENSILIIDDDN